MREAASYFEQNIHKYQKATFKHYRWAAKTRITLHCQFIKCTETKLLQSKTLGYNVQFLLDVGVERC